jgi:hypothetical protein
MGTHNTTIVSIQYTQDVFFLLPDLEALPQKFLSHFQEAIVFRSQPVYQPLPQPPGGQDLLF